MYTLYIIKCKNFVFCAQSVQNHSTSLIPFRNCILQSKMYIWFYLCKLNFSIIIFSFSSFCLAYIEQINDKSLFVLMSLLGLSCCLYTLLVTFYLSFCLSGYFFESHSIFTVFSAVPSPF